MGGFRGRALAQGDRLELRSSIDPDKPDRELTISPADEGSAPVRVVPGPQTDRFTDKAVQTLLAESYRVSQQSSRMALRLDGPALSHSGGHDIASDGIVTGAIQVPGSGQPIALLADRQTTGGYPKIATVISADLPRLGRMRPGDVMRFRAVDVEEAERARRGQEQALLAVVRSIRDVAVGHGELSRRLMRENLISGIID